MKRSKAAPPSNASGTLGGPWSHTAVVSVLVLLAAGSCGGGPIPRTNYYKLHLPNAAMQAVDPLPVTAVLQPLRASSMLTQDRIVYRPTQEEVGFYEYHRWAEDPRTTITSALLERFRQRGTFRQIVLFDGRTRGDYIIRGQIDELEEVDYGDGVSVRVRLSLELTEASSRKPLWQKTAEAGGTVTVGEVRDVVSRMSTAVNTSVSDLVTDLDAFLRSSELPRASAFAPLPQAKQN